MTLLGVAAAGQGGGLPSCTEPPTPSVTPAPTSPPTTEAPATEEAPSTTSPPTTEAPSTEAPSTTSPPTTTEPPATTSPPSTEAPSTTSPPTTEAPATEAPSTTSPPTTESPSTEAPSTTSPPATTSPPVSSSSSGSSSGKSGFSRFFDQDRFHEVFPDAVDLYNFDGLVSAADKYTAFANSGDDTSDKRELAAFLAQTSHESDSFKAAQEYGWEDKPLTEYCNTTFYPCAEGQRYHGRGPIQLTWNYNYYRVGEALGLDIFNNPDTVATDSAVAWMTGLWFWMTPQATPDGSFIIHDVVTAENGFATSTKIINGGLECGPEAT
ncbi:Chitinase [Phytophthora megakarya]|uniref:Chitinase n=1 Tax=Phytophthora megakarya TaxID=4795 RepID=A0A225W731_9STRA|nr:Chitinase [Phytophthora megakarya]